MPKAIIFLFCLATFVCGCQTITPSNHKNESHGNIQTVIISLHLTEDNSPNKKKALQAQWFIGSVDGDRTDIDYIYLPKIYIGNDKNIKVAITQDTLPRATRTINVNFENNVKSYTLTQEELLLDAEIIEETDTMLHLRGILFCLKSPIQVLPFDAKLPLNSKTTLLEITKQFPAPYSG